MKRDSMLSGYARATVEHMPFAGHRTCAQWMAQQEAAHKRSADYGYDLDGLRRGSR